MVVIEDLIMPKNCAYCPCRIHIRNEAGVEDVCTLRPTKIFKVLYEKRQPWCPLIELKAVPEEKYQRMVQTVANLTEKVAELMEERI